MYELPPILKGTEQQQLSALRDYLVRMARSLEREQTQGDQSAQGPSAAANTASPGAGTGAASQSAQSDGGQTTAAGAAANAARLRSLILKTADELTARIDERAETLREDYLAKSDFGVYREQIDASMRATARSVVEDYRFDSLLEAVNRRFDENDSYLRSIRGEIRRGLITDPTTGETAMGIAIAEELHFTGAVHEEGGLSYYELSPGQTLGLYTSTGWQFWVNGSKRGWFDSADGRLHVVSQVIDSELLMAGWRVTGAGGLGVKRMG